MEESFEEQNQLQVIVRDSGLEKTKADIILTKFQDYFTMASEWEAKARTIVVTDEKQTDSMKLARTGRLLLRERRIEIENTRKQLKEQSLREGKAIDGIANVLKALIVPVEEYLEKQEKFIEFRDAAIAEQKRLEVERKLADEEQKRLQAEQAERERIKAENARLQAELLAQRREAEKKEAADRAKLAEERAKLAAERAEADRKLAVERAKSEAALRAEREKAEASRREAEHKAEIERKAAQERDRAATAERERLAEILRNTVTCPHCQKQFNLMDTKRVSETNEEF